MKELIFTFLTLCMLNDLGAQDSLALLNEKEVFTVVEDMPAFPGCEDLPTNDERLSCTQKALLRFLFIHLEYPKELSDKQIICTLIPFSFEVDTLGYIQNLTLLRKEEGCKPLYGNIKEVFEMMKKEYSPWRPGKHKNQKVIVKYTIPLRIHLSRE